MTPSDIDWMNVALAKAELGRGLVEPNPVVGAVVVRGGKVVGSGHHAHFGSPHAEVVALRQAGEAARGASLFVTLEPCCHQGKTPPCSEAIIQAGITRVVAAIRDPFTRVDGGGTAALRAAGVAVEVGLQSDLAVRTNVSYLKRIFTGLPYVLAKWAMTLDGKTAAGSGNSQWISSPGSRTLVHQLRGRMDAIVVGIGTVIADDPMLTARPAGPRVATRIVLDSQARLPLSSQLVRTAREFPVLVAVTRRALADRVIALETAGCAVMAFPSEERVPILGLLARLGEQGMTNVLLEGGGTVVGSFFDHGQVDEVEVHMAPVVEGGDHPFTPVRGIGVARMSDAVRLTELRYSIVDDDMRVRGIVLKPWRSRLGALGRE